MFVLVGGTKHLQQGEMQQFCNELVRWIFQMKANNSTALVSLLASITSSKAVYDFESRRGALLLDPIQATQTLRGRFNLHIWGRGPPELSRHWNSRTVILPNAVKLTRPVPSECLKIVQRNTKAAIRTICEGDLQHSHNEGGFRKTPFNLSNSNRSILTS